MPEEMSLEEAREALRRAQAREDIAREDRKKATPIQRIFTVYPSPDNTWDKVYDSTCRLYTIHSEVKNYEEAKEAGHPHHVLDKGGMKYIFNTTTNHIVMAVGGGMIWTSDEHAMDEISEFIKNNPEGGDITFIISKYRKVIY